MSSNSADKLSGLFTAIFTPLDLHGEIALDLFRPLLEFQRSAGIDGLVVCGTNGEGVSLSIPERKAALDTVLAQKGDFTVVAGTGASSVVDAIELTQHAAAAGADAALVLPPFFFKSPSARGLADYFRAVMDSVDLPIMLYNIPQFSAVPIMDDLLALLSSHPNLAGVKDSAGDLTRTLEFIRRFPSLKIFASADRLAAECYTNGGAGLHFGRSQCVSGDCGGGTQRISRRVACEHRRCSGQAKRAYRYYDALSVYQQRPGCNRKSRAAQARRSAAAHAYAAGAGTETDGRAEGSGILLGVGRLAFCCAGVRCGAGHRYWELGVGYRRAGYVIMRRERRDEKR